MHFRFAELQRNALRRVFDAYRAATGGATSTISKRIAGDPSFFARLHEHRPNTRKTDKILQTFSDRWPAGAVWPEDVPRPPVGKWDDLGRDAAA